MIYMNLHESCLSSFKGKRTNNPDDKMEIGCTETGKRIIVIFGTLKRRTLWLNIGGLYGLLPIYTTNGFNSNNFFQVFRKLLQLINLL